MKTLMPSVSMTFYSILHEVIEKKRYTHRTERLHTVSEGQYHENCILWSVCSSYNGMNRRHASCRSHFPTTSRHVSSSKY